jgi:hypothetical protein
MQRKDFQKAIERLWPNGLVELSVDYEDSWFVKLQPKVTRALRSLKGSQLLFEREAEGDPVWWPESHPDQAPPDECAPDRSYHLYFIVPDGDAFKFTTESEDYIDGSVETVNGAGRTGWCIAVSLLAPFAVITLGERIEYENGDTVEPSLESHLETMDGSAIDPVEHFREMVAEEAFSRLMTVQRKIAEILEKCAISVLPEKEWKKRVSRLRAGDGVSVQEPLHVLDALFFEGV